MDEEPFTAETLVPCAHRLRMGIPETDDILALDKNVTARAALGKKAAYLSAISVPLLAKLTAWSRERQLRVMNETWSVLNHEQHSLTGKNTHFPVENPAHTDNHSPGLSTTASVPVFFLTRSAHAAAS